MELKRVMQVKVLGSGCSRCHEALEVVNKVVAENNVAADGSFRLPVFPVPTTLFTRNRRIKDVSGRQRIFSECDDKYRTTI